MPQSSASPPRYRRCGGSPGRARDGRGYRGGWPSGRHDSRGPARAWRRRWSSRHGSSLGGGQAVLARRMPRLLHCRYRHVIHRKEPRELQTGRRQIGMCRGLAHQHASTSATTAPPSRSMPALSTIWPTGADDILDEEQLSPPDVQPLCKLPGAIGFCRLTHEAHGQAAGQRQCRGNGNAASSMPARLSQSLAQAAGGGWRWPPAAPGRPRSGIVEIDIADAPERRWNCPRNQHLFVTCPASSARSIGPSWIREPACAIGNGPGRGSWCRFWMKRRICGSLLANGMSSRWNQRTA